MMQKTSTYLLLSPLLNHLRNPHYLRESSLRTSCPLREKYRAPKLFFLLFIFIFPHQYYAQHVQLTSDDFQVENSGTDWKSNHNVIKPILRDAFLSEPDSVSVILLSSNSSEIPKRFTWNNYYQIERANDDIHNPFPIEPKTAFLIRPVYDFNVGQDMKSKKTIYTAVGGAILDADYKQKIGLEVRFVTGTSVLPNYSDSIAQFSGMMPGWGDRAYMTDSGHYAFQHLSGNLIYRPSKVFNIQIGRDKHFWGDGYRSLFLSDGGAAMPYLKMQTTIWKLQYTSLFTWMQDWTNSGGYASGFRSKFGTFHYIDFNAAKWLNLGVFESVIFQGRDDNRMRGFDPNYLNPIIFYRPVEYSLGSSDNAMLGLSLKLQFNENNQFYAQILLDEFYLKEIKNWKQGWWGNKQGVQMGYKIFNMGTVKNLNLQMEMNIVRPYTYSHGSPQQNYANAGMPLAHPLGANFAEMLGMLSYSYKGFSVTGKLVAARYGLDANGTDFGQNIFISYIDRTSTIPNQPNKKEYNHHLFDGVHTNLFYAELKIAYRFKTKFPLRVELLAGARSESNVNFSKSSSYVQIGLSLPIWRTYRDY